MNLHQLMPTDTTNDALGEAPSLLRDTTERRPYQAYCVTEASSTPPSPDSLIPSPLRTNAAPPSRVNHKAQDLIQDPPEQSAPPGQAAISSPKARVNFVTLLKTGKSSKRRTQWTNRARAQESSIPATSDHITQPVIPRDTHLLAAREVTRCDQHSSHLRVQRLKPVGGATRHAFAHKPIPLNSADPNTNCRPLPPLPIEGVALGDERHHEFADEDELISGATFERSAARTASSSSEMLGFRDGVAASTTSQVPSKLRRKPLSVPYDEYEGEAERRGPTPEESLLPMLILPLRDANVHDSSKTHRAIAHDHTQPPPSGKSHVPRGHWSDTDDEMSVPRRRSLKDANSKYQVGEPPPRGPDISTRTVCHTNNSEPPFGHCAQTVPAPAPSFHSSTDAQNGPRPPPWGSYEDLSIQRRQRNELRERAQILASNTAVNSMWTYQKSLSTDSLSKDPAREVEEYREQILTVYPDMEFDGAAGGHERHSWCCMVM